MDSSLNQPSDIYEHHAQLALNLYKYLLLNAAQGNFVFCPLGILTSLCIIASGAEKATLKEFQQLLKSEDLGIDASVHTVLMKLVKFLESDIPNNTFHLVHGLHMTTRFTIKPDFQTFVTNVYAGSLGQENFQNAEVAASNINQWVADKTNNKIQKVIDPADLDELTSFILTSAAHFKSDWTNQFLLKNTVVGNFQLLDGQKQKLFMMMQTARLNIGHHDTLSCSILEMPYTGNHLAMMVVLPDEIDGLAQIESALTPQILTQFKEQLQPMMVNLQLPKFSITSGASLKESLAMLGLKKVFNEGEANLSRMSVEKLFVSKIQHHAMINVDESGTEAAAVTVSNTRKIRSIAEETNFLADHPFLFYILDKSTGYIVFFGRFLEGEAVIKKEEL